MNYFRWHYIKNWESKGYSGPVVFSGPFPFNHNRGLIVLTKYYVTIEELKFIQYLASETLTNADGLRQVLLNGI